MTRRDLTVWGLGVSGATLAYAASRTGFRVVGFDIAPRYRKACGDVVTLRGYTWSVLNAIGSVLTFVRRFIVRVNGFEVSYLDFHRPVWAMVDKSRLVNGLRAMAEAEGAVLRVGKGDGGSGLVVDARGPYAHRLEDSVLTVRFIARTLWEPGLALIDFDTRLLGFYWVFPLDDDGRLVNIGSGFKGLWDAGMLKALTLRYYKMLSGRRLEVLDTRGAPISVKAPIRLYDGGMVKVGEAAGLVNSTTGEGNRYAIHSALALVYALKRSNSIRELLGLYGGLVSSIVDEVSLSRTILSIVEMIGSERGAELMASLPKSFWTRWFTGRLYRRVFLRIALNPRNALGFARALVSSA